MSTFKRDKGLLVAKRFFEWAENNELTQRELAGRFGIREQALSNWKAKGTPARHWQLIADLMKLPLEILTSSPGEVDVVPQKTRYLPLISSVHAGSWTGVGDQTFEEFVPVITKCSKDSFCLTVEGDSMEPTLRDGDIVVVDPEVQATPGRIVVAMKGDDVDATIKRYKALGLNDNGAEIFELLPENSMYAAYRSDKTPIRLVGVVVSSIRNI